MKNELSETVAMWEMYVYFDQVVIYRLMGAAIVRLPNNKYTQSMALTEKMIMEGFYVIFCAQRLIQNEYKIFVVW